MKTTLKSNLHTARHMFSGAVFTGAALLMASSTLAQNLFVADSGTGDIYEYAPDGTQSIFASGLSEPSGLAFNSEGDLFVADNSSGNIYEYTPGGARSTFASGLSYPWGLAFNSAGDLFVASSSIYEYTPGGVQSTFAPGGSLGLAFDSAGNLYGADYGILNLFHDYNGSVTEMASGGAQSTFVYGLAAPMGLAFDRAGDLIVATGAGPTYGVYGSIIEIGTDDSENVLVSGMAGSFGIAIDNIGNLYVDGSGDVEEYTSSGAFIKTVASGLSDPSGLAFQPVPEPSVWGLLIAGFAPLLAASLRLAKTPLPQFARVNRNGR